MAEFKTGDRVVKMSGTAAGKYGTVNSVSESGTLNVTFDGERLPRFCDPERCGKVTPNADTPLHLANSRAANACARNANTVGPDDPEAKRKWDEFWKKVASLKREAEALDKYLVGKKQYGYSASLEYIARALAD